MTIPYRFQTEILIVKLIQNQKGRSKAEPLQNPTNLDKTMAKKQNELISILGWTSGDIPRRWQVVMIGDENDFVSVSSYLKKGMLNSNPGKIEHSVAFQNNYWRI